MPARLSPFKENGHASPLDRWAMTLLATEEEESWRALRWELERPEPSYTIDTVRELSALYPGELFLILGADNLQSFPTWHESEQILRHCRLLVAPRENLQGPTLDSLAAEFFLKTGFRPSLLDGTTPSVSSSSLRTRLGKEEDVSAELHPGTLSYIRKYGLYVETKAYPSCLTPATLKRS